MLVKEDQKFESPVIEVKDDPSDKENSEQEKSEEKKEEPVQPKETEKEAKEPKKKKAPKMGRKTSKVNHFAAGLKQKKKQGIDSSPMNFGMGGSDEFPKRGGGLARTPPRS